MITSTLKSDSKTLSQKTIRWALIGIGDLANKKIAPALHEAKNSVFSGIWARNPEKAQDFAKKHNVPTIYSSVKELLDDSIDAVYVATSPDVHCEYTLAALRAGKHVIVEKPMASNVAECEQMVAAAKERNLKLGVAYNSRNAPKMQKVKELVASGILGKITYVNICFNGWRQGENWRLERARSAGGGAVADEGVHRLDLLDFWLGPSEFQFSSLERLVRSFDVEDSSTAVLKLKNSGAPVHLYCAWNSWPRLDRFDIFGSEGRISLDPLYSKNINLQQRDQKEVLTIDPVPNAYTLNVEDFHEAIATGRPSICDGETGLRTARLLEKILAAKVNLPPG